MLRFAPSPTGNMHIGNLRAAVFNYIIAKQRGEKFLLRIEDTDTSRNKEDSDKSIFALLNLFRLHWDKQFYQSENFPKHRHFAQMLLDKGLAFYCYCSEGFLEQKFNEAIAQKRPFRYQDEWAELEKESNPNPAIRLRGSKERIVFEDIIKGEVSFEAEELDSFVIVRSNGVPTYNFACAIDDMLGDISLIVRGEDHVSNTPRQILVHRYLGYDKQIQYAHLPILLDEVTKKKLSKRHDHAAVNYYLERGFLPQAILNYLIGMGNKTPCEIFTLQEALEWFKLENLAKSPVVVNFKRLRYINREHMKRLSESDFALLLETQDLRIGALGKLFLEEASTLNEVRDKIALIFTPKDIYKLYENQDFSKQCEVLFGMLREMLGAQECAKMSYGDFKNMAMQKSNLKGKDFFKPLRILLTGEAHGLELEALFALIAHRLEDIITLKEPASK